MSISQYLKEHLNEDVSITIDRIKELYDKFNKELFDNDLPNIPIRLGKLRDVGGQVSFKRIRKDGIRYLLDIKMVISSYYSRENEDDLKGILLHEMIHVYFAHNQMEDPTGSHGAWFKHKLKELQKKVDFQIPMTDSSSKSVSDQIKSKTFDVVLFRKPAEDNTISILKKDMIESPMLTFSLGKMSDTSLDYLVGRYDDKVIFRDYIIYFLQSDDRELLKYPVARQFKTMKYFKISNNDAERILNNGRLILKLDKEELKKRIQNSPDSDYRKSWEKYF